MGQWQHGRSTRRALLGAGATALGALGTAGCSSLPPLGSRVTFGKVDAPAPGDASYRQWLPAPAGVPAETVFGRASDSEAEPKYFVSYVEPRTSADAPASHDRARRLLAGDVDHFGVAFDRYERAVTADARATACEGDVDPASVGEAVTASGYEAAGTYREYDLYARRDSPRAVAVADGVVLFARVETGYADGDPPLADVRALADAGAGEVQRLHEVDEDFAAVAAATGSHPSVAFGPSWLDDRGFDGTVVESASGSRYDGDAVYAYLTAAFAAADGLDRSAIETRLRRQFEDGGFGEDAGLGPLGPETMTAEVDVDGRVVSVQARLPQSGTDGTDRGGRIPVVTWGFDETADRLTIRHEAGETVPAAALHLASDLRAANEPDLPQWTDYETVGPGDTVTVDRGPIPDGTILRGAYDMGAQAGSAFEYEVGR